MVLRSLVTSVIVLAGSVVGAGEGHLCQFVPENNLKIPTFIEGQGVTKQEFNEVIDRVESVYAPIVSNHGGKLTVKRKWDNATVNAQAYRAGSIFYVDMFGGLARHRAMTKDGLALVVCHEIGHHIGGAPKIGSRWASNEGQSDYFAGLKCLRRVFAPDAVRVVQKMGRIDDTLARECSTSYKSEKDIAICVRIGMAGMSVAKLFQDLRKEKTAPSFDTPDNDVVSNTVHTHPATQCRLDTYFQGGLCTASLQQDVDQKDAEVGTCNEKYDQRGLRPRCWYNPDDTGFTLPVITAEVFM